MGGKGAGDRNALVERDRDSWRCCDAGFVVLFACPPSAIPCTFFLLAMGRRYASSQDSLEISIHGDEQEHNRIQLEHNLQDTSIDIHLSETSDVEYPRHIDHSAGVHEQWVSADYGADDYDAPSLANRWSYRTLDDDPHDPIHAYAGETISTAAHHASALTLSAGLHGRAARRTEISLSGAEYDPDRPLDGMIGGVDPKFSAFEDSQKYPVCLHPLLLSFVFTSMPERFRHLVRPPYRR